MQVLQRGWDGLDRAFRARPWLLAAAIPVLYGVGHTDFKDYAALTRHPFELLSDPGRQFLHSSPLTILIGWPVTRSIGPNASYVVVCLAGILILAAALSRFLRGIPAERRSTAGLVLLSSPMLLVLLSWMGKSDTYLIAFYLLTLPLRGRAWPTLVLCALIVVAHREIGTVVLLGDLILRRGAPVPVVCGGLLGYGLVSGYAAALSGRPADRVDFALALLRRGHLWQENPVAHLVLGPGWLWTFLARLAAGEGGWRVAAVLALDFAATANTSDFTRDFIMCCTPLAVYAAERIAADPAAGGVRWPALFLIQAQIAGGNQVLDSTWLR